MRSLASRSRRLTIVAVLAATLLGCGGVDGEPDLAVPNEARVAEPVAGASQVAFSIVNSGDGDDRLLSASTDAAMATEIHRTTVADGIATMEVLDDIEVPAGERLDFRPGGLHLMLVVPDETVELGGTLELVLEFERSDDLVVEAEVVDLLDLTEDATDDAETG